MVVLGVKIGEGMVPYWPPITCSYFWGFLRLCQFCWKPIKKCDRESVHRRTHRYADRQTDWQTQTDFSICPMLHSIAMGQIIMHIISNSIICHPYCMFLATC